MTFDWEVHRQEICQLYEHNTLEEVVRLMKERRQFEPGCGAQAVNPTLADIS